MGMVVPGAVPMGGGYGSAFYGRAAQGHGVRVTDTECTITALARPGLSDRLAELEKQVKLMGQAIYLMLKQAME